jgi:hypothetical protein
MVDVVDGGGPWSDFPDVLDGGNPSTVYPLRPELTVYLDANPAPRVEVLLTKLTADVATVTVYRLAAGREYQVRGAVNAATAGSLTRIDNEVPFGIPVTYRAELFDAQGLSLGFTGTSVVQLDVPDMWVHNPLDPHGAVRADFRGQDAPDLTRPSEGDVYYPQGRRVGVLISGQRRGLSGVRLDLIVDSEAEADRFAEMLGTYSADTVPALCFRVGAGQPVRLPRPFFAAVLSSTEQDLRPVLGIDSFGYLITGDEIDPPAVGIVVPLLTNADLNATYATNAELNGDNLTNLAVNRRYDLAGTAS